MARLWLFYPAGAIQACASPAVCWTSAPICILTLVICGPPCLTFIVALSGDPLQVAQAVHCRAGSTDAALLHDARVYRALRGTRRTAWAQCSTCSSGS